MSPNPFSLANKRLAAKVYLGRNWVFHPNYQPTPRHSNDPNIYVPARQQYCRDVSAAAAAAREANPFFTGRKALS